MYTAAVAVVPTAYMLIMLVLLNLLKLSWPERWHCKLRTCSLHTIIYMISARNNNCILCPSQINNELPQPLFQDSQWNQSTLSGIATHSDWSDEWLHCQDSLCNKVVVMVCHGSSKSLSSSQLRAPCCNPSASFDLRHSACQFPAPTSKLVTLWQLGDGCLWSWPDSYTFSPPSIIAHRSFCVTLLMCIILFFASMDTVGSPPVFERDIINTWNFMFFHSICFSCWAVPLVSSRPSPISQAL